jgi:RNA polymerase sigma factor (sigma-70 family)
LVNISFNFNPSGTQRLGTTARFDLNTPLFGQFPILSYLSYGNQHMDFALQLERSEQQLIQALSRHERWAQQQLYEQHYGKMMGVCLRYAASRDEALDLLHEGFIKVFQNIHKYRPGTTLIAWIRTIVVNTCIDHYRRNQRRRTEDIDTAYQLYDDTPDVLSNLSEREILAAVQQLSGAYRAVFNLYVVEGYSHKEVADALQITESTSRSNLVKARLKLQEYFAQRRDEFETVNDKTTQQG